MMSRVSQRQVLSQAQPHFSLARIVNPLRVFSFVPSECRNDIVSGRVPGQIIHAGTGEGAGSRERAGLVEGAGVR